MAIFPCSPVSLKALRKDSIHSPQGTVPPPGHQDHVWPECGLCNELWELAASAASPKRWPETHLTTLMLLRRLLPFINEASCFPCWARLLLTVSVQMVSAVPLSTWS